MKTFNQLTKTLRWRLADITAMLEKHKAKVASDSLGELAYTFRRSADDVIRDGEIHSYLLRIVRAHEKACLDALEENNLGEILASVGPEMLDEDTPWWNERAAHFVRWIAEDTMRVVLRGVNVNNNPMYLIEEAMKVEAAKKVFETFVSGYMEYFFGGDAMQDVLDGHQRREEAEEAERAKKPHTVTYSKQHAGASYNLVVTNHRGVVLFSKPTDITRKPEAKAFAEGYAAQLQEIHKSGSIFIKEG